MPWPKGKPRPANSGRKAGTPNKRTAEVEAWARGVLEDPAVRTMIVTQLKNGSLLPPTVALLFYYAYGKPVECVESTVDMTFAQLVHESPRLSDVELKALLSTLRIGYEPPPRSVN
jgi:hypothetical protein